MKKEKKEKQTDSKMRRTVVQAPRWAFDISATVIEHLTFWHLFPNFSQTQRCALFYFSYFSISLSISIPIPIVCFFGRRRNVCMQLN